MLLARNDQKAPADRVLAPRTTVNLDEADCVAESFDVPRRIPATHASMVPGPTSLLFWSECGLRRRPERLDEAQHTRPHAKLDLILHISLQI
jgi:hypothetical protein